MLYRPIDRVTRLLTISTEPKAAFISSNFNGFRIAEVCEHHFSHRKGGLSAKRFVGFAATRAGKVELAVLPDGFALDKQRCSRMFERISHGLAVKGFGYDK